MNTNTFASSIDYSITQYTIDADIQRDGGVNVTEYLEYKFNEAANGIYRDIDFINPDNVLYSAKGIDNIAVYEEGITDDNITKYTLGNGINGSKGIYSITKNPNGIRIKIYAPAKNEKKRFIIQYHLINTVVKYRDTADFYWQFIGKNFETDLNNVSIVVTIPKDTNSLRIFSHGPFRGNTNIVDQKTIQYTNNVISSGSSVSLRMLFPSSIITGSNKSIDQNKLASILKEEAAWAKEANLQRQHTIISIILAIIWPILCIILLIYLYNKYGKSKKSFFDTLKEPPASYGPAFTEYILNYNTVGPNGITAEIMNLVRKKYVTLEEILKDKDSKKNLSDYQIILCDDIKKYDYDHEYFLINWFFNEIGDGKTVTFKEIKKYSEEHSSKFNNNLEEFKKIIKAEAEALGFKKNSTPSHTIALYFFIFSTVLSLILGISYNMYAFLISAIFNSMLLFFLSFLIKKATPELELEKEKWLSYKKYLKSLTNKPITEEQGLSYWEEALLYTIVFGYYKGAIKQLKVIYPTAANAYNDTTLTYLYHGSSGFGGIDSFSSCITSSIGNFSSTTGFSSGGSSVGGTGGGGGGGGAF